MTRDEWREYRSRPEVKLAMAIARKKWRTANPETYRAGQKRWSSANRDRVRAIDQRHRDRKARGESLPRACNKFVIVSGCSE